MHTYIDIGFGEFLIAKGSNLKMIAASIIMAKATGSIGDSVQIIEASTGKVIKFAAIMRREVVKNGQYSKDLHEKMYG